MAERARENASRQIRDVARPRREVDHGAFDAPSFVEADLVSEEEIVPLPGRQHVVVATKTQLDGPAAPVREQRGNGGDDRRLAFLSAERAAHAPHLDSHRVARNAEHATHAVLHFRRVLRGRQDQHFPVLAGHRQRYLSFEIEVVLTAASNFAGHSVRSRGDRLLRVAANDRRRRAGEQFLLPRFFDRQHGRQFLEGDFHKFRRRERLIVSIRRDRRQGLTRVFRRAFRQYRLAGKHRRDIVDARNVGRGHDRGYAGRGRRRPGIDGQDARMGMRAENQRRFLRSGRRRDVVDIRRRPGHVLDRAFVAHLRMNRADDVRHGHRLVTSRSASAPERSRHSRTSRFDATRMR